MKKNLGQFYDETSSFQQAQFNYLRTLIAAHADLDKVETLLDIGAGTGQRTKECFDIFPNLSHITALEPDPDMYGQALKHHADPRIEYLKKSAAYVKQMIPAHGNFDAVLSNWAMHWIQGKQDILSSLERIVRPDGVLMISTSARLPDIMVDMDGYIRTELNITSQVDSPYHHRDINFWEDILPKSGWNIRHIEQTTVNHRVEDAAEYLEHLFTSSTGRTTYNRHLVEITEAARKDIAWVMQEKYSARDGTKAMEFTEDVLFVIAGR